MKTSFQDVYASSSSRNTQPAKNLRVLDRRTNQALRHNYNRRMAYQTTVARAKGRKLLQYGSPTSWSHQTGRDECGPVVNGAPRRCVHDERRILTLQGDTMTLLTRREGATRAEN